jgi:hypothetical protein
MLLCDIITADTIYISHDMDGRTMINSSSVKSALVNQVDTAFYIAHRESVNLNDVLFNKLSDSSYDEIDNHSLKLVIDNHLLSIASAPNVKDIFHDNASIDGVIKDLSGITKVNQSKRSGAFADPFTGKSNEADLNKSNAISRKRNDIILAYFDASTNWPDVDMKKFELPTIKQVGYGCDEEYMTDKTKVSFRDPHGYAMLATHVTPETDFEAIRFIGENEIALDFEDIGYHIKTTHPVNEYLDIIELETEALAIKSKYDAEYDLRRFHRNVEFILEKTCDHLENLFGPDLPSSVIKNGSEIARLLAIQAKTSAPSAIAESIDQLLVGDDNYGILSREFLPRVGQMFKSEESVELTALKIRNSMMNVVDFDALERDMEGFDRNIENTVELKKNGDELSFKREYKKLNVFERMSVDLTLSQDGRDYATILSAKGYDETDAIGVWTRGKEPQSIDVNNTNQDELLKKLNDIDCVKLGLDVKRLSASLFDKYSSLIGVVDDSCLEISISKLLRDSSVTVYSPDVKQMLDALDGVYRPKFMNDDTSVGLSFVAMDKLTHEVTNTVLERAHNDGAFTEQVSKFEQEPVRRSNSHLKLV